MNSEKILQVCEIYDERLSRMRGMHNQRLDHLRERMMPEIKIFVSKGNIDKAFRWLGFMQGVLWSEGVYDLHHLKIHNMPDEEKEHPMHVFEVKEPINGALSLGEGMVAKKKEPHEVFWSMKGEDFYSGLDPGIRFAVKVLHSQGIETCQSCEGGKDHCYDYPTVEMVAGDDDVTGFAALAAFQLYGIQVYSISMRWSIFNGLPYEKLWRIEISKPLHDRADENPSVIWGHKFIPDPTPLEAPPDAASFGHNVLHFIGHPCGQPTKDESEGTTQFANRVNCQGCIDGIQRWRRLVAEWDE